MRRKQHEPPGTPRTLRPRTVRHCASLRGFLHGGTTRLLPLTKNKMKPEKEIIQETRLMRLDFWLKRQPLDASLNGKIEAAEAFKMRLQKWAESKDQAIAPSFHLAPI